MKPLSIIIAALLIAIALLFFPVGTPSSSVFYLSLLFLAVAFVFAYQKGKKGAELAYLRLAPKTNDLLPLIGAGALALIVSCLASGAISLILNYFGMLDTQNVQDKLVTLSLPALIIAFTLAPIAEEALFRGLLFRKISEWSINSGKQAGFVAGAISSSIIFAALHASYGSFAELAVAFAIGIIFCFFTYRTKSLVPAIVAHISFNFLSILFAVWLP
ncbi:MAG: type II CAAX endopeptidase family protein [Candidatus Micrarchaeota archaeon]|nr:type II CAAX endopeptidase family protein [Candidatus Micrarchaeota archaeon]